MNGTGRRSKRWGLKMEVKWSILYLIRHSLQPCITWHKYQCNWIVQCEFCVPEECKLLTFEVNNNRYLKFQLEFLLNTPYFFKVFKLRRRLTGFSEYFNISSLFMLWWFKVFSTLHFFLSVRKSVSIREQTSSRVAHTKKMSLKGEASATSEAVGLKCELRNNFASCYTDLSNFWRCL